ncbi:hypothetical protein [Nocardioides sp. GXZ039]|uniref:hypothetical protein n=1 Tax=Nocardioides sp. GXZ039 TaxID=3136018 RepID=UPI0030F45414
MVATLPEALPRAEFSESHTRLIQAPPERVWEALWETNWSDLGPTRLFMAVRGLGLRRDARAMRGGVLAHGPVRLVRAEPPHYAAGVRVARPWQPRPTPGPDLESLDDLRDYSEPGWLKFGMDFWLVPTPEGDTLLTTRTLCEPTDAGAGRRFRPYWLVVRPFSGLIRRDLLRTLARRAMQTRRASG